jgi:hypothetical protein
VVGMSACPECGDPSGTVHKHLPDVVIDITPDTSEFVSAIDKVIIQSHPDLQELDRFYR